MPEVAWCAQAGAAAHVLVDRLDDRLELRGADGHHLRRVRRLTPGELVTAADGTAAWRRYRVDAVGDATLALRSDEPILHEPALTPRLTLACAPTKGARPDAVVRHATELAVDAVWWVATDRTVVHWDTTRGPHAVTRLQRVARDAAQQCRRARLPTIQAGRPLRDLAGLGGLVVADRDGAAPAALPDPPGSGWVLVIGPEGGLTDAERAALGHPPSLALGPHVLRAETAALAGAATLTTRRHPTPSPSDHPA